MAAESLTPLLVSAREASRLLCLSQRSLYTLTKRGELPAVRIGRAVRYAVTDLRAWIESRKAVQP
jgi:excisionase family DNA binding protein